MTAPEQTDTQASSDPVTPGPWDCSCGPAHNSAMVVECPTCHTPRPFDYTPPTPTPLTLDERFDIELAKRRAGGSGLTIQQSGSRAPGYHVPVRLRQGESSIDVDSILIQSILDVGNRAAQMGAVVEIGAQMISPTQGRLTLQVEYDFAGQPLPHTVAEDGAP